MAFEWLAKFHQRMEKDPHYAQKTLTAYRLGMKAKGSIAGVSIKPAATCCDAARELPVGKVYHPDEVPQLPLPTCTQGLDCNCVYRPVMSYEELAKRKPEH